MAGISLGRIALGTFLGMLAFTVCGKGTEHLLDSTSLVLEYSLNKGKQTTICGRVLEKDPQKDYTNFLIKTQDGIRLVRIGRDYYRKHIVQGDSVELKAYPTLGFSTNGLYELDSDVKIF